MLTDVPAGTEAMIPLYVSGHGDGETLIPTWGGRVVVACNHYGQGVVDLYVRIDHNGLTKTSSHSLTPEQAARVALTGPFPRGDDRNHQWTAAIAPAVAASLTGEIY